MRKDIIMDKKEDIVLDCLREEQQKPELAIENGKYRPMLMLSVDGTICPGAFYLNDEVNSYPKFKKLFDKYDEIILELEKYFNKDGIANEFKTWRYCSKLGNISSKMKILSKKYRIRSLTLKEKDLLTKKQACAGENQLDEQK